MALTLSGTNGVVGAGFTLDASGASVTAGVGTFGSLNAPAAGLTGALPALNAASLTQIPAANIVGVCTAGLGNASGAFSQGKILQTVSTTKTDTFSSSAGSENDITGLSASITPSSSSSKILISAILSYGGDGNSYGGIYLQDNSSGSYDYTFRADAANANDGVAMGRFIATADTENSYKLKNTSFEFLHSSNTTNAITYKLRVNCTYGLFKLNRVNTIDSGAYRSLGTSTLTLMEIAA